MTALLALAFGAPPIQVVRLPEPSSPDVVVAALVKLPKLNDAERICIKAAWNSLLEGSEEYSGLTLRAHMQQSGVPIAAAALQDHLVLRVTFPKAQLGTAGAMVESLLRRPLLSAESLEKALAVLKQPKGEAWSLALDPESWKEAKPTRAEILGVYRRLVRPENLHLAFGGSFEDAGVQAQLSRIQDWAPAPERGFVRPWAATFSPVLLSPSSVGTLELASPEFSANDPSFPVRLLVSAALGMGKGSALHRAAREEKGWSYRQEAFLQPTAGGFRLRMLLGHHGDPPLQEMIEPLREALSSQVKGWAEADRKRALASLESWLEDGIGLSPMRLLPQESLIQTLEERTHLAAWWRLKFGRDFDPAQLLQNLQRVTLEELKAVSSEIMAKASARMLVPR